MEENMCNLIDINEASAMLKLKTSTLYKMICQKRIPVVRLNSRVLFSQERLEEWIKKNSVEPINGRT